MNVSLTFQGKTVATEFPDSTYKDDLPQFEKILKGSLKILELDPGNMEITKK